MIIFAAGIASSIMLLAGIGLLIYMLLRKSHLEQVAQRRSQVISDTRSLPRSGPTEQHAGNSVEMADFARDINGQLTTKMIVLEQLIADSQKQIERMEALLYRIEEAKKNL